MTLSSHKPASSDGKVKKKSHSRSNRRIKTNLEKLLRSKQSTVGVVGLALGTWLNKVTSRRQHVKQSGGRQGTASWSGLWVRPRWSLRGITFTQFKKIYKLSTKMSQCQRVKTSAMALCSKQSPAMVGRALPVDPDSWSGLGGEL